MIETIAIYFTPLASTKVAAVVGLGLAYHMAIIYTDGAGRSFGASSGPSASATAQTPALALRAIYASAENRPSAYGTLLSDPKNNHMFIKGHPEDYYTQDFEGMEYPHVVAATGRDLSAQWTAILASYATIGAMH